MADLDTRNKRASALGFAEPFTAVFPDPDGAISTQADRQHIGYSYPGILVGAIVVPAVFGDLTTLFAGYLHDLKNAHPLAVDTTTLVAKDLGAVRAFGYNIDDANTMYATYISSN